MILRPQQIFLLRMGLNKTMANGGGGGSTSSQQATSTSTQLTNDTVNTDRRSVASDQAIALGGDGNMVFKTSNSSADNSVENSFTDNSQKNTSNSFSDASVRLNTNTNTFSDSSEKNTNTVNSFEDNSIRTSTVTNTTSDFGAISAGMAGMRSTAERAMSDSSAVTLLALNGLTEQSRMAGGVLDRLFTTVGASSANSQGTAMQTLGLANNAIAQASAAVTGADKKQEKMLFIIGGVVGLIFLLKK
ncbi:MAG: hypothetical protein ACEQSE_00925 [Candidatus Aquirickettsiella gammari]